MLEANQAKCKISKLGEFVTAQKILHKKLNDVDDAYK